MSLDGFVAAPNDSPEPHIAFAATNSCTTRAASRPVTGGLLAGESDEVVRCGPDRI